MSETRHCTQIYLPLVLSWTAFWLTLVVGPVVVADETFTFPYVAYVKSPTVQVRSGPGLEYYPTQQIPLGHAVEVYRHDASSWCAIRPPAGSFSWVPTGAIRSSNQHYAEVLSENVEVRVGSLLSGDRGNMQIRLYHGERVQVLAQGNKEDRSWTRIEPPAGEFRWIAAADLTRTPPVENKLGGLPRTTWKGQGASYKANTIAAEVPTGFGHLVQNLDNIPATRPALPGTSSIFQQPPPQVTPSVKITVASPAVAIPGSPADLETRGQSTPLAPATAGNDSAKIQPAASPIQHSSLQAGSVGMPLRMQFHNSDVAKRPTSDRIQELQLRLSQTIIRPKEEWQFEQLTGEASAMLNATDSVTEREQLRDLLDRIALFQRVQSGDASSPTTPVSQTIEEGLEEMTGQSARVRELARHDLSSGGDPFEKTPTRADEPRFDAVGRLKPVLSDDIESPRYALVDDRGGVVSFVTPTPDLNLKPYVGMRIGVNGSRGFMPEYRKAHVTAGRVTPIEDRIRR